MRKWMVAFVVFTVALTIGSKNTNAQTELTLTSDGTTLSYSAAGNTPIVQSATVNGWVINVVATETNSPGLTPDGIDLTSLSVKCIVLSCQNTPLSISMSGTNFTQPVSANGFITTYTTLAKSGVAGSTTQVSYDDTTNTFFGTGTTIGTLGPLTGVGTRSAVGGGPAGPGQYSLTIDDTFKAGGSNATFSTFGNIAATPEPGSMLLFGTGLLVAVGVLRRRLA
jgi:PEP-CTERM motif